MPWSDYLLGKNRLWVWLSRGQTNAVASFALNCMKDRDLATSTEKSTVTVENGEDRKSQDFLSRFIEAHHKHPDIVTPQQVVGYTASNVFAGSDTTAITLRAILYYLLRNPSTLKALRSELKSAELSDLPQWKETNVLPYLSAIVKEGLRMHPAVGVPMERVVPSGGVEMCGQFFEEGTVVGISPWVMHRNKQVFGSDADKWRPERWLSDKGDMEGNKRIAEMDRCMFAFGSGKRTCIGKKH